MTTIYDFEELQKENERLKRKNFALEHTVLSLLSNIRKHIDVENLPEFDRLAEELKVKINE